MDLLGLVERLELIELLDMIELHAWQAPIPERCQSPSGLLHGPSNVSRWHTTSGLNLRRLGRRSCLIR